MLSTWIKRLITILFVCTLVLGQSTLQFAQGLVNLYLFKDDWTDDLKCEDLTPVACLTSSGALDTSRLHCARFTFNGRGELAIGENTELSLFTDQGGTVLLGSRPREPVTKWAKIGTNSDHVCQTLSRCTRTDRETLS
jgi:hypothetical protein